MRKILSYAKSHIYDLHAILTGTIVFVAMQFIKKPVKKYNEQYVDRLLKSKPHLMPKRDLYLKRCNMILIFMVMALAIFMFAIVALISPVVEFSAQSAIMSGVYALCEYAFMDQITANKM